MIKFPPRRRPGPRPRMRAVRPTLHNGQPGPRPLTWVTGPDPLRHEQFVAFGRARAQALFRQEPWHLTFEEFLEVWGTEWSRRGRHSEDLCMTRQDIAGAWSLDNVELITRAEHNRRCVQYRMLSR